MYSISDVYSALNHGKTTYTAKKLTATFNDREKYVIHFANLKYYLQQGMILKKVHRVLAFRATYFLRDYITWCTNKRQQASSTFSKDLFKLLANACYGKFIQSDEKRILMNICTDEKSAERLIASPLFIGARIINENTMAIFRRQSSVKMNKMYAIGFSILENSKRYMYQSYYDIFQPHFTHGDKIECDVVFSDTDRYVRIPSSLVGRASGF